MMFFGNVQFKVESSFRTVEVKGLTIRIVLVLSKNSVAIVYYFLDLLARK